jgi:hypothetical protein
MNRPKGTVAPRELFDFLKSGLAPIASSQGLRARRLFKRRFPDAQVITFTMKDTLHGFVTCAFLSNDEKARQLLQTIKRLRSNTALERTIRKTKDRSWAKSFNYQPPNRKGKREVSR